MYDVKYVRTIYEQGFNFTRRHAQPYYWLGIWLGEICHEKANANTDSDNGNFSLHRF
jgi:hypothetical protein